MEIIYLPQASEDLTFWINSGNKAVLKKIARLTEAIIQNPYQGIGKPKLWNMPLPANGREELLMNTGIFIK